MRAFFDEQAATAARFGLFLLVAIVTATTGARAAEIKVLSTVALTPALDELVPKYQSSGNQLTVVYNTIAELKKRIEGGETADVILLSRPILETFEMQGKLIKGSVVDIGASYVAVGVRAGAPLPDISTPDKLKGRALAVRSISYADPAKGGASGVYFAKVLDRLGLTEQMKAKTRLVPNAQAGELVVSGEAEIGVAQASEIATVPGTQFGRTVTRRPQQPDGLFRRHRIDEPKCPSREGADRSPDQSGRRCRAEVQGMDPP